MKRVPMADGGSSPVLNATPVAGRRDLYRRVYARALCDRCLNLSDGTHAVVVPQSLADVEATTAVVVSRA